MKELRDDQAEALDRLRAAVGAGKRRIIVQASTGFGKTVLASHIVNNAASKNKRVLFTVPAVALIDQTVEAFWAQGVRDIGVIQAQHVMTDWSKPIQIASVQTLQKRPLPKADVVLVDECFAAGTLVETTSGPIKIENIKPGDCVHNATGIGFVVRVVEQHKPTICIRLSTGKVLNVTADHPVFTDSGWRKAGELEARSRLFSREALRALFWRNEALDWKDWEGASRGGLAREAVLLELLREEARESDEGTGSQIENGGNFAPDWSHAEGARGQWAAYATAAAAIADGAGPWLDCGASCSHDAQAIIGLPDLLQDRHSQSRPSDWHRNRWRQPCFDIAPATGSEKDGVVGDVWVESVSRDKQRSDEPVFNLRVTGHPSYFANGVLVHNCHKWFRFYEKWFFDPEWKNVPIIGLSATPWTKGLGCYYEELIVAGTTENLIESGALSPFRVFAPSSPDLKGVRTVAGDYHEGDLSAAMDKAPLIADVVHTWLTLADERPTLCFAVDRAHAHHLQQQFLEAGVACGYQDAHSTDAERREIKRQFHNGEIKVVCNVGTLTTGVDWDVRCLILARPTKSRILFTQIIGRALRTAPGKDYALILDHSDSHLRLGYVTDIKIEKLDDGKTKTTESETPIGLPKKCPKCAYLKPPRMGACPNCGFKAEVISEVETKAGELKELNRKPKGAAARFTDKESTFGQLKHLARERGHSSGWAAHKYREIFGTWPNHYTHCPEYQPTPDLLSWVKSTQIRYAKRRQTQSSQPVSGII